MLAKHVHDAAWAQLTAMLDYKAASAGVELVKVALQGLRFLVRRFLVRRFLARSGPWVAKRAGCRLA